jgi:DNA-binding protein H-NS
MADFDFSRFETVHDLRKHIADLKNQIAETEAEIVRRMETHREQLEMELREQYEMSAEDFFQLTQKQKSARSRTQAPKYRNPNKPEQTWSGRGKQPKWFVEALEDNISREEMEIKEDT